MISVGSNGISEYFGVSKNPDFCPGMEEWRKKDKVKSKSCGPELELEHLYEIVIPVHWKGLEAAMHPVIGEYT